MAAAGTPTAPDQRRKRRGIKLVLLAVGMLAFAFINVPLFRVFCEHYGFFVQADEKLPASHGPVDPARNINVVFTGITATGLPVTLTPTDSLQTIHLDQRSENQFTFTNNSNQTVRFRAIHDIFPASAATHLALIQCFCFSDQTMAPHTSKTLPVIYQMNQGLDPLVSRVSVMYTLEPLAPAAAPTAGGGQ
ncbi:MAG TPA: cytochrome c oxidase assembly protein [Terriglobales bacterium]|nr:cytochrome c oxidase assembly protein [Terriglobales bacterium]